MIIRAIVYDRFGSATDVLQQLEIDTPTPGPGEVLVRLATSGVNPSDIRARAGGRPGVTKPPFPIIIPHSDGAGVIETVGEGVSSSRVGQRVWIWNGQWQRPFGTAAEYIAIASAQAVQLPDSITFEQGAVLGIPAMTATHAVLGSGPVTEKVVLVSGGAGTVGRLAVQVAVASGAHVVASVHGKAEAEAAKAAGADAVVDYLSPDMGDQILDATQGKLVDHVVEVEFGKNVDTIASVIAERGRIVTYGSALVMTPTLPFYPLLFKGVEVDFTLVYLLSSEQRAAAINNLTTLLEAGALDLRISQTMPLENCAQAHEVISSGQRAGSIILTIN